MEISGTWKATPANDELRRAYPDPDHDDTTWATVERPGGSGEEPGSAGVDATMLYRTRLTDDMSSEVGTRSWLVLDGVGASSDIWLDGTYLGDTEGSWHPHGFEVTDHLADRSEHTLALEVHADDPPRRTPASVRIERSGPVRIRHLRVLCAECDEDSATVALRAVLDVDADAASHSVTLRTLVCGVEHVESWPVAAGENRVEWQVALTDPDRWWPWALGPRPLHEVEVTVLAPDGGVSDARRRRLGLRSVQLSAGVLSINGERLFLAGTHVEPGTSGPDGIGRARRLGLGLLRVHAHVAEPAFYDAADEAGMLIHQDLPLVGRTPRSARRQARSSARELVDLCAHHPSVVQWWSHSERDVQRSTRQIVAAALDRSVTRVFERSDRSRPTRATAVPLAGVLTTADGPTATTDLAVLVRRWPRAGRFVVALGEPGANHDPDALGRLLRSQIDVLRRVKYRPCGGFVLASLAATSPEDRWAFHVGHRATALADVLRAACADVSVTCDLLPSSVAPGKLVHLRLHVVNDRRVDLDGLRLDATVHAGATLVEHRGWEGGVDADGVAFAAELALEVPDTPGVELAVDITLTGPSLDVRRRDVSTITAR